MSDDVRVLVVEDEPVLAGVVSTYLSREGYEVRTVGDGLEAVALARGFEPDLMVLDLGLPGIDGYEVCRRVREFSACYVVMLTARDEEADKIDGLSVGADDYVTKPFSARELTARVQAMLRRPRVARNPTPAPGPLVFGDLALDLDARTVLVAGAPADLTRTEFDVLASLAAVPHKVLSRRDIVDAVWGPDWVGDDHLVDVHIGHVRKKLREDSANPRYVMTVRGVGYRMGTG